MRRINTGDVVAVAIDGVKLPPVGRVHDCDDDAISLRLYQWINGYFGGPEMLIRRRDIRATLWAVLRESDDDEIVFDMEPLAQFQTSWLVD